MMKIKEGFVLRKVGKEQVIVAIGPAAMILNGLIKLNTSGVFLWKMLSKGVTKEEMVTALQKQYDITGAQAAHDVEVFVETLRKTGCLEET